MSDSWFEKLSTGKYWEDMVEQYFKNLGYKTKRFTVYDSNGKEIAQRIKIKGTNKNPVHPDIEMEINRKDKIIKYLVEVKSMRKHFRNHSNNVSINILQPENKYVSIPVYQFEDYNTVQEYLKIETRIIFVIREIDQWYWESLDFLEETKILAKNGYGDDKSHYYWDVSILKQINNHA